MKYNLTIKIPARQGSLPPPQYKFNRAKEKPVLKKFLRGILHNSKCKKQLVTAVDRTAISCTMCFSHK